MSVHVRIYGDGPDLVFVHGWGLRSVVWDTLIPALELRYRVHLLDLPGHGESSWDDSIEDLATLAASIATIVPNHATLVGWSLGGLVAQYLAAHRPDLVATLVLITSTPKFLADGDWTSGVEPAVLDDFATKLKTNYAQTVSDFLTLQVRGQERATATLRELKARILPGPQPTQRALQVTLDILRRSDLRKELASIHQPTLVLAGEHDRLTPPAACKYLAEHIRGAQFRLFHRAAHALFISHAEKFTLELLTFLASHV